MIWVILTIVVLGGLVFWHGVIVATLFAVLGTSLVVGAPLFWLLCLAESGLIFYCLDYDDHDEVAGIVGTVSLLVALLLLEFFGNVKVFTGAWWHPWWAVFGLAGYFAMGGGWSIIKWWFEETDRFRKSKEAFLLSSNLKGTTVPATHQEQWVRWVQKAKTDPSSQKYRFYAWIGFWPWSFAWTLLNDPFKRLCRRIYYELQAIYQRITDHVWRVEV